MKAFLLLLVAVCLAGAASAQTLWSGSFSDRWDQGSNWNGGTAPNSTGAWARFNTSSVTLVDVNKDTAGRIEFVSTASSFTIYPHNGVADLHLDASTGNALVDVQGGSQTFSVPLFLDDTAEFRTSSGTTVTVSGSISGSGGLTKTSAGSMVISGTGSNTYTGITTVSAGTLTLQKSGGATAVAGNIDITGGTLLVGASNQVADTSAVTLSGGTLGASGGSISETVGSLTFSAASTLDFGSANFVLSAGSLSGSSSISIVGWSGNVTVGGGADQVIIGSVLSDAQLNQVSFSQYPDAEVIQLPSGELVPVVPEMGAAIMALIILGYITASRRTYRRVNLL